MCGPYFSTDMLSGDVVPIIVLIDSGVVRIRILLARMLGFARFWVSAPNLSMRKQAGYSRHPIPLS
jgi:hypothetical protein